MIHIARLVREAAAQGWTIEETQKGLFFVPPEPSQPKILVHRKPSDIAVKKTISRMRRSGFQWPPPKGNPK